jgi:hypothetical protein
MARLVTLMLATAASLLIGAAAALAQASPPDPDRIVFRFEHTGDLRGVLNVFQAFRLACLRQPLTRNLPARLVPDGYQVVSRGMHWWGKDEGELPEAAILSRTGREDSDVAGGYPIIDFLLPTEKRPGGGCSVEWKRAWQHPDASQRMSLDLAASLPAHISYHLRAVLLTQPDWIFQIEDRYVHVAKWKTSCWSDNECTFEVRAAFDSKGIDITISFREVN